MGFDLKKNSGNERIIGEDFDNLYLNNENLYKSDVRISEIDRLERTIALVEKYRKKINGKAKLLDVGCGTGRFTHSMSYFFNETLGIDVSKEAIQLAAKNSETVRKTSFKHTSITQVQEYDWNVITSLEVLYYLTRDEQKKNILEIYNHLTPGGFFICSFITEKKYIPLNIVNTLFAEFSMVESNYTYRFIFRKVEMVLFKVQKHIFNNSAFTNRIISQISGSRSIMKMCDYLSKLILGKKAITRAILVFQK
ncbi:MAG: methyltransferase domain-containing protein [Bacteroidetes bacterium]|nr:methyltransferase domain-containing protein [Bacteroidota bacterium]